MSSTTQHTNITPQQLHAINERWEQFFYRKRHVLDYYAGGDQDLVSLGLISVRKLLCQDVDFPTAYLLRRAQLDMLKARGRGSSIDTQKLTSQRKYPLFRTRESSEDVGVCPESDLFDALQYQQYWASLTSTEQQLIRLLKEEKGEENYHWYQGEYVPVARRKGSARKRFMEEVNPSETAYKRAYAQARFKFYQHFGSEVEIEREWAWFSQWKPCQSLHASRNGKATRRAH